ncbi:MAG: PH domain-containing protein [Bacteroidia bacterium]
MPLENIQDLSFIGGPILRSFGLTMIKIETAGGGGGQNSNMMSMIGINNAEEFKSLILHQREIVIKEKTQGVNVAPQSNTSEQLLREIKNELVEIKNALKNKS